MAVMKYLLILAVAQAVQLDHFNFNKKARNPEDVWVPFASHAHADIRYFNPVENRIVEILPHGARKATTKVALIEKMAGPGWDGDCSPKCTWECKKVECEKECHPQCELPKCQTRCRDPDMSQCTIKCDQEPHCATFCPPQKVCKKDKDGKTQCHKPDCATKCEKPQCHMFCGNNGQQVCENVCAEPKCDWKCVDPKTCPKPECCLKCHQPKCQQSVSSFALPPLGDGEKVVAEYRAKPPARWETGPWSACDCKSNKQYRQVKCGGKLDTCGLGETPATSKRCEIPCKGHFEFGEWSECKGDCWTEGYQYREGNCVLGNCGGQSNSRELRKCRYDAERCHTCQATMYGRDCFNTEDKDCDAGWKATFGIGTYEEREMRQHNARAMDTSSLKVMGFCCAARLYQYSNRNRGKDSAWEVVFPEGVYGKRALEERGAFNDEASSLEVFQDQHCIDAVKALHNKQHSGAATAFVTLAAVVVAAAL